MHYGKCGSGVWCFYTKSLLCCLKKTYSFSNSSQISKQAILHGAQQNFVVNRKGYCLRILIRAKPKYGETMLIDISSGFIQTCPQPLKQHFSEPGQSSLLGRRQSRCQSGQVWVWNIKFPLPTNADVIVYIFSYYILVDPQNASPYTQIMFKSVNSQLI